VFGEAFGHFVVCLEDIEKSFFFWLCAQLTHWISTPGLLPLIMNFNYDCYWKSRRDWCLWSFTI